MSKNDLGGVWRTVGGRRIFIKDGQDLESAMRESGKFNNKKNNENSLIKEKAINQTWNEFYDNLDDDNFFSEIKKEGLNSEEAMREYWVNIKLNDFSDKDIKEIPIDKAIEIVVDNISMNELDGWFRNADSNYKTRIETKILQNKELRNAGLNIAYNNYIEETRSDISYKDYLNKELTMYRGEHGQKTISKDVFKSYTTNKKMAEKFGTDIKEIKIKPIDTLGSYQTTSESEYLVPIKKIKK